MAGTNVNCSLRMETYSIYAAYTVTRSDMFYWMLILVPLILQTATAINMSTILDDMFRHYDQRIPPRHDQPNKQVNVQINIHVVSMYSISEADMDYSMTMLIGQKWFDERLMFDDVLNFTRLELDDSLFNQVWTPDLYILNEHFSDFHEVMVPNKFVHIYPDGLVHHLARVTGTYSCHMLLHKYPFDTQYCHIEVGSLFVKNISVGHRIENIKFVWHEEALTIGDTVNFPQFHLINVDEYNCEKKFLGSVYPCIGLEFTLKRNSSYFIIEIYIPSILIVLLSWMSFWIDCAAVPARVSLGLLTVLTMTTQSTGSKSDLPQVSYIKALDVYLTTCLAFVFLGLLEFACVNVLTQSINNKINVDRETNVAGQDGTVSMATDNTSSSKCFALGKLTVGFKNKSGMERARLVDGVSKILFPGTFILFNIIYWSYYMT